jgi:membrane associated rhomboid family serine protease
VIPLRDNIPTDRLPIITIAIIVANVLVYFLWQRGGLSFGDPSLASHQHYYTQLIKYSAIPHELTRPGTHCGYQVFGNSVEINAFSCGADHYPQHQPSTWITPFTAMFMHGGLLHLGGNMLFLWIFGNNIEDAMGRLRFIAFYLLGGIAAFALQVLVNPGSDIPTLGASGAIAAVLGAYLLLYPRARVLTVIFIIFFFTLVEIPALFVLGFWFLLQLWDASNAQPGAGGVAYFAHIGGFAFGLLLIRAFATRQKDIPPRLPVW